METNNNFYDSSKDSNYRDELRLFSINNDEILQEDRIGTINKTSNGNIDIYVYGKEGKYIPHFHLIGNNLNCCICIYDNKYFSHGVHKDKINSKTKKILNGFLKEKNKTIVEYSNWQVIGLFFDISNQTNYFNKKLKQPDYTKLE